MTDSLIDNLGSLDQKLEQAGRVLGVIPALVTNSKDPETLGRVKVNFPWLAENSETDWIRVAAFMGGPDRGAFFLPEVGDEVLVAFIHGNIDEPCVIGGLWNKNAKPPEKNADGKNNVKVYKSRCGHTLTFNDNSEENKALVELKTNAGHYLKMDDNPSGPKVEIVDKSGNNKITIDTNSNAVNIESQLDIKLKSTNITIEATGNLQLKGAVVKAEASATMNLEASGITVVKGSLVKIN